MKLILENATIYTPTKILEGHSVIVSSTGKLEYVGPVENAPEVEGERIDLRGRILAPGFIDIHRHGGGGVNFGPGGNTGEELVNFGRWVAREGVTGFLCSIAAPDDACLIDTIEEYAAAVAAACAAHEKGGEGAEALGIHLEGPYLNKKERKGAFNPDWLRNPSLEEAGRMIEAGKGWIRQATMDPTLEGAREVASLFRRNGVVVAMGHTDAGYEEASAALRRDFTHVTHAFNAMKGFHHRDPGALGALLASDGVTAELIADGYHVHPAAMKVLIRCLGTDRVVAITDAIAGSGMKDGQYELVGYTVTVKDGQARLADGTIAGCTTPFNRCVEILHKQVGVTLVEAVKMGTLNPARAMGFGSRLGSIREGMDASLVVIDEDVNVCLTMVKGKIVYENDYL